MSLAPDYTDEARKIVTRVRTTEGKNILLIELVRLKLQQAFLAGGRNALALVKNDLGQPQRSN